jgi:diguanylate cyclase
MNYSDTKDRSAELLRLAIPMMAQHPASLNPITYAVWYDYLSGRNNGLKTAVDEATRRKVPLGDDLVRGLYQNHIAQAAERASLSVSDGLREVISEVRNTASQTEQTVSTLGQTLAAEGQALPQLDGAEGVAEVIGRMLSGTRHAEAGLGTLLARLHTATSELDRLREELGQARQQATVDALTGVTNRRGFDEALAAALAEREEGSIGPSIVMIDLDHFKKINDSFGHLFGDTVLKSVGQALRASVKGRDLVARYGGEEFVVLLPETPLAGAASVAEQIRRTIAGARIRRGNGEEAIGGVTVSLGVSTRKAGDDAASLVERADRELYRAKEGGRNRVSVAT